MKLYLRHTLHAKLYLAHRDDSFNPVLAFLGSSNLTMSGLRGQGELNIDVLDKDAGGKLVQWFKDRWEDERCLDITEDLIAVIEESWAGERLIPPHHIYLKMAWHLSEDARDGVKEFRIPHDVAGELMQFQVKAVQLACRHLNKRGGVLVGDVVGLGKTRVASAIARVMGDDQMLETLIICPRISCRCGKTTPGVSCCGRRTSFPKSRAETAREAPPLPSHHHRRVAQFP